MAFWEDINNKRVSAWRKLYMDYYAPLCNYAMKILSDKELSEDVVSDVFMRMWEKPLKFDSMATFTTYLYKSVHNNSLKFLQRRNISTTTLPQYWEEDDMLQDKDLLATIILEETVRKLRGLIDSMPEKRKQVMLLSLEDKTVDEIALQLMLSPNTVKKHKKEAYLFLRKFMWDDFYILFFFSLLDIY